MQHRQSSKDRAAGEIDIFILKNGETVEIRQPSSPRSSYVRLLLGGEFIVVLKCEFVEFSCEVNISR